ncbi:transposase [Vagococcus zengguangii]|uniref:Transposase n=1 Tax=Vagococcus zengguangii TaxID=2571750 RepID=A0A4D7CUT7_9ENTE|nr:transposase [Vagococcus zengguangii]QCI86085.1 transposase [Vagococcus zengguangii]QCI86117.1 transposase [Vagococcus zengguangii]
MNVNILQAIFFDKYHNWDNFIIKYSDRLRPVVKKEVAKFRNCGDIQKGYRLYVCEGCHDVKFLPLRCKGKFCPSCAKGESERWSETIAQDMYHTIHRHIVFTIDEGLRDIFLMDKYRSTLLKGLMDEAAKIIIEFFDKRKIQPGIISGLHTFGSQLEFNPHVHMIVTMGGVNRKGEWENYDYLPYVMLRKYWQNAVLKLIRRTLSPRDKAKVQYKLQKAYHQNGEGFYVNAPKRSRTNTKGLLQYISRYMKRGPIALERIKMYDGHHVMFEYHDKRTNRKEMKTMTAEEFIGALVRHIPDRHFRMIRHYGIYSRRIKSFIKKIVEVYQEKVKKLLINSKQMLKSKTWAQRITECFGKNPLDCPNCGEEFVFMGMSVCKNGRLITKYTKNKQAMIVMKEENIRLGQKETQHQQKEKTEAAFKKLRFDWEFYGDLYMSPVWNS